MNDSKIKTIIAYTRVSTDEQASSGSGIQAQEDAIARASEHYRWEVEDTYSDPGVSGCVRYQDRPGLAAAVAALNDGQADALAISKLDRLSRSMIDFAELAIVAKEHGWDLVALDLGMDTSTPAGGFVLNVLGAFAQFEREMISSRTKEGLAVRRRQGIIGGRPRIISPEVRARIVREREEGKSLEQIANALEADGVATAQGGERWRHSTVSYILQSEAKERNRAE